MLLSRKSFRTILSSSGLHAFLGRPSTLLAKELERFNYKVGFYPLTSVNSLSRLKDWIPDCSQSGTYKLTCEVCATEYVGQTGCRFEKRLKERRNDFNNLKDGTPKKKLSDLSTMAHNHHFNNLISRLIHRKEIGCNLNSLEQIETLTAIEETNSDEND